MKMKYFLVIAIILTTKAYGFSYMNDHDYMKYSYENRDEPSKAYYEQPKDEYEPSKAYYEQPKDEYEPSKAYYEPPKDEYEPPKDEYEPPKDEYEPSKAYYNSVDLYKNQKYKDYNSIKKDNNYTDYKKCGVRPYASYQNPLYTYTYVPPTYENVIGYEKNKHYKQKTSRYETPYQKPYEPSYQKPEYQKPYEPSYQKPYEPSYQKPYESSYQKPEYQKPERSYDGYQTLSYKSPKPSLYTNNYNGQYMDKSYQTMGNAKYNYNLGYNIPSQPKSSYEYNYLTPQPNTHNVPYASSYKNSYRLSNNQYKSNGRYDNHYNQANIVYNYRNSNEPYYKRKIAEKWAAEWAPEEEIPETPMGNPPMGNPPMTNPPMGYPPMGYPL